MHSTLGSAAAPDPIRLGVIVPSANTVLEPDFFHAAPPGTQLHFTRVWNAEDTPEQLAAIGGESARAAELLSHARVRAIAFGCTSGSFLEGLDYDRGIVARMETAARVPCVTTAGCIRDALRVLGVRRPHLLTPYSAGVARRGQSFLEAAGFQVAGLAHLDLVDPHLMLALDPPAIVRWACAELSPAADGIVISCTNMRALAAAEALEAAAGVPVVTSNQATLWGLLRAAGVEPRLEGYGRLLRPG
jgi:maleate isomerase